MEQMTKDKINNMIEQIKQHENLKDRFAEHPHHIQFKELSTILTNGEFLDNMINNEENIIKQLKTQAGEMIDVMKQQQQQPVQQQYQQQPVQQQQQPIQRQQQQRVQMAQPIPQNVEMREPVQHNIQRPMNLQQAHQQQPLQNQSQQPHGIPPQNNEFQDERDIDDGEIVQTPEQLFSSNDEDIGTDEKIEDIDGLPDIDDLPEFEEPQKQ